MEIVAQLVELADRLAAIAGSERRLHQRALRLLVGGIERDETMPQPAMAAQFGIALLQALARLVEPVDIDVVGQEHAAIKFGRLLACGGILAPQRRPCRRVELLGIDDESGMRRQHHGIADDFEQVMGAERAPGEMDRLAQVRARRLAVEVGPEHIHELLAMQPVRGREREQLDERGGAVTRPVRRGNGLAVEDHRKASEQLDENAQTRTKMSEMKRPPERLNAVADRGASGNAGGT